MIKIRRKYIIRSVDYYDSNILKNVSTEKIKIKNYILLKK